MLVTRTSIVEAVSFLKSIVDEWEAAVPPNVASIAWQGQIRKAVSEEIQEAATSLFELVSRQDIAAEARSLVLAIDEFDDAFFAWASRFQGFPERNDPAGDRAVWEAYHRMLAEIKERTWPKPEPMGALVSQKIPHRLIAKMYGWYQANGLPDESKVQEELTTPGTHYDAKQHVSPARRRYEADLDERWSKRAVSSRSERPLTTVTAQAKQRKGSPRKLMPESLDEFITQGINLAQIVKMTGLSAEQVRSRATEIGYPIDGSVVAQAFAASRRMNDREKAEADEISRKAEDMRVAGINSHPEKGDDLKTRVLAMHADGQKARDIVAALANAFPGLQYQKVVRIVTDATKAEAMTAG